ncbi:hypothetical protein ABMA28_006098 [Loxostege sticticalis]|uniref:Reverse transcriptase domain-containing protein n=1 Tax=Loxostege sticticalis TaxID=481309 RepID=A0ABD0SK01_LOXSC
MDDIKLYASSQNELEQLADITEIYTQDICMEFGIDKCKINSVRAGQNYKHYYKLDTGEQIEPLEENETYKYLGYNQSKQIHNKETKQTLNQKFRHRLNIILKSQLYAKNTQISNLRSYFHDKTDTSPLHKAIAANDHHLTPLNLQDRTIQNNEKQTDRQTKIDEWARKSLHGRHHHDLNQVNVDKTASNEWLSRGELFPETEGFMLAIQDQVIETRNYQKYIIKARNLPTDLCRKCNSASETIQHITGACKSIVQTDFKHRHDQVANIVHQKLAVQYKLLKEPPVAYYKYVPSTILENQTHKLYFDRAILTDKTTHYNRPDIIIIDKINRTAHLIDIAIPNTHNLQTTIAENLSKYIDLKDEVKRLWNLHKVSIVPIVLSTTGVIPKQLHQSLETIKLPKYTYLEMQKAVILNTCRIVRKFLQSDEDSHNHHSFTQTSSFSLSGIHLQSQTLTQTQPNITTPNFVLTG